MLGDFTDPCPSRYEYRTGSIPGGSINIGSSLSLSLQDCTVKCDENDRCLAFEHSNANLLCNLHEKRYPTQQPIKDHVFCAKIGEINCKTTLF